MLRSDFLRARSTFSLSSLVVLADGVDMSILLTEPPQGERNAYYCVLWLIRDVVENTYLSHNSPSNPTNVAAAKRSFPGSEYVVPTVGHVNCIQGSLLRLTW